ncbi:MAG TPA: transcriptional regulator [Firmicutes bacterium]|nr:transcriptional regulator [Bacillota bacterium]HBG43015.1 transcriptional regulator [Bacillota bacterium]HBL68943.1 transcriptional regulator [Bacillota bacterium]HCF90195.1 transcriptional regulator [Bacillota bacterium]HCF92571.1 transcriptional regulator [Bacillota bacterium]
MLDLSKKFWEADLSDIRRGYYIDVQKQTQSLSQVPALASALASAKSYVCLICGAVFEKGIIYPMEGVLYEAERAVQAHIAAEHGSLFEYLLGVAASSGGITELQSELLRQFHQGTDDAEIAKLLGQGSTSTVRNHRFKLREKEKQAKVYLALMSLVGKQEGADALVGVHRGAKMVDERYVFTEKEKEQIIHKYFEDNGQGPLIDWPSKEKRRVAVVQHISAKFEPGRQYTEKEVNEILKQVYELDYVILRRYLIEYGFLDRTRDGSSYWVKL